MTGRPAGGHSEPRDSDFEFTTIVKTLEGGIPRDREHHDK